MLLAVGLLAGALVLALAQGRIETDREGGREDAAGSGAVVYGVCEDNLASVEILEPRRPGERFALAVQLDRPATRELERLTGENLGRPLEIVLGDWLFLRGPIRQRLRSGLLVNTVFRTRAEAEAALHQLRSRLPRADCGPAA